MSEPKLLSDKIEEFFDWLERETDFDDWSVGMKDLVKKKLIEIMTQR